MYTIAAGALALISLGFGPRRWRFSSSWSPCWPSAWAMARCFSSFRKSFSSEIGVITGLVGMAGGIGGFYLASSLGIAKQLTVPTIRASSCSACSLPARCSRSPASRAAGGARGGHRPYLVRRASEEAAWRRAKDSVSFLVGNGMAGMRTIDEILARDRERFEIEVIGAEATP